MVVAEKNPEYKKQNTKRTKRKRGQQQTKPGDRIDKETVAALVARGVDMGTYAATTAVSAATEAPNTGKPGKNVRVSTGWINSTNEDIVLPGGAVLPRCPEQDWQQDVIDRTMSQSMNEHGEFRGSVCVTLPSGERVDVPCAYTNFVGGDEFRKLQNSFIAAVEKLKAIFSIQNGASPQMYTVIIDRQLYPLATSCLALTATRFLMVSKDRKGNTIFVE